MEAVGSGIPGAWGQEGVGMSQKKQAQHKTLPLTLPLLLPCPQLQPCPQASGFRILPMTPPPTALTPTISPRKDSSARSSALWLCLTVYPPQDLQQLLLCPLGVQLGQGMAGHLLSFPTASSSLASHLQPCPLLSTPHWPLERYSSTYSNLVQALTPSDTPHCPQDKFWIFIYNV